VSAAVGLFTMLFFGAILLIVIGGTVLWIMALVDCIQKESATGNDRIVWLLIILFLHLLGAILYFLIRRPQRIRELGH